jgi:CRP/FNR family transcriptional regulator, transcriptional activator FtrB
MRASDFAGFRKLPLFAAMKARHFTALMRSALVQTFPPQVDLIVAGELPDFLYILLDGAVELYASHADRKTTVQVLVPPATFILAPIIRGEVPLKSARTLIKSRVLMIPTRPLLDIFGRDAEFARAVVTELSLRYRDLVRAIKSQKLRTGSERLANWILQADARNGRKGKVNLPFEKRLLASLLGMSPENLSRAFSSLIPHGVRIKGPTVSIKDRGRLRRLAQEDPLIEDYL